MLLATTTTTSTNDEAITRTPFSAMLQNPLLQPLTPSKDKVKPTLNYLDLGCGNGSVLQMVSWSLMEYFNLRGFGIEARSEAVALARRSLSFNVGPSTGHGEKEVGHYSRYSSSKLAVIHADFRGLEPQNSHRTDMSRDEELFERVKAEKFDLITGTPPYFRVDFSTEPNPSDHVRDDGDNEDNRNRRVTTAVIQQGGMPTSMQSAPARCEFRGGVEAYCTAASAVLADNGIFVVCENWLNDTRVHDGAAKAELHVDLVLPVKGKTGRKENLFAVYVLRKRNESSGEQTMILEALPVRSESGKWTVTYAHVLEAMSIPAHHDSE